MKIKFLYIENGKITLTKQELEQLLEESYQDGVTEGRKNNNSGSLTYQPNERQPSDYYYTTPYWGIDRAIPVTCNDLNAIKVSSSGEVDWASAGTVTITGNCTEYDGLYSTCTTSVDGSVSGKAYTDAATIATLSTSLKEEK